MGQHIIASSLAGKKPHFWNGPGQFPITRNMQNASKRSELTIDCDNAHLLPALYDVTADQSLVNRVESRVMEWRPFEQTI
jgi:hypothetical protein